MTITIAKVDLAVGQRVRLDGERCAWTVRAVTENFDALVQQAPFHPAGVVQYTVIDWRNGVRGPCNLIGQGWGDGSYSPEQCAEMLAEFENHLGWPENSPSYQAAKARGETQWACDVRTLEVSHRNRVTMRSVEPLLPTRKVPA